MPTPRELLERAEQELATAGVASPRVDAELLLGHVTGRPRALLRLAGDVSPEQAAQFSALVEQRAGRVPLQHLTGSAPFRQLELVVGPGVFVPRPETEQLVDLVLARLGVRGGVGPVASGARLMLVDLCTGSGALALALATEVPGTDAYAVDVDPAAAGWARRNLERHAETLSRARSMVQLLVADATTVAEPAGPLAAFSGLVDVVVSNPPYVPDAAVPRDPEVRDHDPALALFGGPDGLDVVRRLVGQAARLLRPGGLLVIEHADVQGEEAAEAGVPALLRATGDWTDVLDHRDLAGRPRHTSARRPASAATPTQTGPRADGRAPDQSASEAAVEANGGTGRPRGAAPARNGSPWPEAR